MNVTDEHELNAGLDSLEERMTCLEAAVDELAELIRERFTTDARSHVEEAVA